MTNLELKMCTMSKGEITQISGHLLVTLMIKIQMSGKLLHSQRRGDLVVKDGGLNLLLKKSKLLLQEDPLWPSLKGQVSRLRNKMKIGNMKNHGSQGLRTIKEGPKVSKVKIKTVFYILCILMGWVRTLT